MADPCPRTNTALITTCVAMGCTESRRVCEFLARRWKRDVPPARLGLVQVFSSPPLATI